MFPLCLYALVHFIHSSYVLFSKDFFVSITIAAFLTALLYPPISWVLHAVHKILPETYNPCVCGGVHALEKDNDRAFAFTRRAFVIGAAQGAFLLLLGGRLAWLQSVEVVAIKRWLRTTASI